jgi:hypothetical protein
MQEPRVLRGLWRVAHYKMGEGAGEKRGKGGNSDAVAVFEWQKTFSEDRVFDESFRSGF